MRKKNGTGFERGWESKKGFNIVRKERESEKTDTENGDRLRELM